MPTEFNLHVESKNKNTRLTDREQIGIARRGEEVEKKIFFKQNSNKYSEENVMTHANLMHSIF